MAVRSNGTGYLEFAGAISQVYPRAHGVWVAISGSADSVLIAQVRTADPLGEYIQHYGSTLQTSAIYSQGAGDASIATRNQTPDVSLSTWQYALIILPDKDTVTLCFANSTKFTTTRTNNDISSYLDRFLVGALHWNGESSAQRIANGSFAEAAVFGALADADIAALFAGARSETITSCVDYWPLLNAADLTSRIGNRTFTAVGSISDTGALAHPVVRAAAAPVLSSPSASPTSATTATASVTTTVASGTLYTLVNTSTTATASAIKSSGTSQAVTATGAQSVSVTGLTASTAYYTHFVHVDTFAQDSNVANGSGFSTPALPAAVLSSPAGTPTSTTTATATVSTTIGSGTLYFMVSANATETASTVKSSGASQAVSASGTQNVAFSGLSASTLYYTHFVQVANAQDSNVANGSGFTTPSVSAAVLSSPSASAVANTTATANVTTNTGSGTLYCLVSANPTETVTTIKASSVSKTVTATGAQTFSLTGLTQSTQYYLHFVQTVTGVDSGVSNSSSFTTTAPTVTFTPVCALKAVADGALAANVAIHAFVHDKTTGALVGTKSGLNSGSTAIPPAFTATFGVAGTQYDVKFVDDANALRRSLEAITPV